MSFINSSVIYKIKHSLEVSTYNLLSLARVFYAFLRSFLGARNAPQAFNSKLSTFGLPKTKGSVGGMRPEYVVSRILMRHPSESVRKNMELLHSRMQDKFSRLSDDSLEWLLGGSRQMSRGGFRTVKELRDFLEKPVEQIPSSRLITGLETLLTAIGYRAIRASWVEAPQYAGNDPEMQKMASVIDEIMDNEIVEAVSSTYPDRSDDTVTENKYREQRGEIFTVKARRVSNASFIDGKSAKPLQPLPDKTFRRFIGKAADFSWVGDADSQNITVRAHVSGTAPLCCAAIEGLLRNVDGTHVLNEKDAQNLYTALLIPQFHRSDFHSIAETQAGIEHYIAERNHNRDNTRPRATPLSPVTAFERAVFAMIESTRATKLPGETKSPREEVALVFGREDISAPENLIQAAPNYLPLLMNVANTDVYRANV